MASSFSLFEFMNSLSSTLPNPSKSTNKLQSTQTRTNLEHQTKLKFGSKQWKARHNALKKGPQFTKTSTIRKRGNGESGRERGVDDGFTLSLSLTPSSPNYRASPVSTSASSSPFNFSSKEKRKKSQITPIKDTPTPSILRVQSTKSLDSNSKLEVNDVPSDFNPAVRTSVRRSFQQRSQLQFSEGMNADGGIGLGDDGSASSVGYISSNSSSGSESGESFRVEGGGYEDGIFHPDFMNDGVDGDNDDVDCRSHDDGSVVGAVPQVEARPRSRLNKLRINHRFNNNGSDEVDVDNALQARYTPKHDYENEVELEPKDEKKKIPLSELYTPKKSLSRDGLLYQAQFTSVLSKIKAQAKQREVIDLHSHSLTNDKSKTKTNGKGSISVRDVKITIKELTLQKNIILRTNYMAILKTLVIDLTDSYVKVKGFEEEVFLMEKLVLMYGDDVDVDVTTIKRDIKEVNVKIKQLTNDICVMQEKLALTIAQYRVSTVEVLESFTIYQEAFKFKNNTSNGVFHPRPYIYRNENYITAMSTSFEYFKSLPSTIILTWLGLDPTANANVLFLPPFNLNVHNDVKLKRSELDEEIKKRNEDEVKVRIRGLSDVSSIASMRAARRSIRKSLKVSVSSSRDRSSSVVSNFSSCNGNDDEEEEEVYDKVINELTQGQGQGTRKSSVTTIPIKNANNNKNTSDITTILKTLKANLTPPEISNLTFTTHLPKRQILLPLAFDVTRRCEVALNVIHREECNVVMREEGRVLSDGLRSGSGSGGYGGSYGDGDIAYRLNSNNDNVDVDKLIERCTTPLSLPQRLKLQQQRQKQKQRPRPSTTTKSERRSRSRSRSDSISNTYETTFTSYTGILDDSFFLTETSAKATKVRGSRSRSRPSSSPSAGLLKMRVSSATASDRKASPSLKVRPFSSSSNLREDGIIGTSSHNHTLRTNKAVTIQCTARKHNAKEQARKRRNSVIIVQSAIRTLQSKAKHRELYVKRKAEELRAKALERAYLKSVGVVLRFFRNWLNFRIEHTRLKSLHLSLSLNAERVRNEVIIEAVVCIQSRWRWCLYLLWKGRKDQRVMDHACVVIQRNFRVIDSCRIFAIMKVNHEGDRDRGGSRGRSKDGLAVVRMQCFVRCVLAKRESTSRRAKRERKLEQVVIKRDNIGLKASHDRHSADSKSKISKAKERRSSIEVISESNGAVRAAIMANFDDDDDLSSVG